MSAPLYPWAKRCGCGLTVPYPECMTHECAWTPTEPGLPSCDHCGCYEAVETYLGLGALCRECYAEEMHAEDRAVAEMQARPPMRWAVEQ